MPSVGTSHGMFSSTGEVFVTGSGGVAALDTPQSSQTKAEIRSLVAEIAELSATGLPQSEFLNAVLPRICSAMGATAAALWQCSLNGQCDVVGQFRLPESLVAPHDDESSDSDRLNHSRILGCIAAEGSAVLVPPKSVRVAAERPVNPLDECLLIVPIKIDDRYEMLLEVIQPASGGPAAQRGYLRFVAQMADLMSDYLRRARLRTYATASAYVEQLQSSLLAISRSADQAERFQVAATALAQLLDAELVILATRRRILTWQTACRVCAISHVPTFDARSEIVLATQALLGSVPDNDCGQAFTILTTAELISEGTDDSKESPTFAKCAQQLRGLLGCSHLAQLSLSDGGQCQAVLAFDSSTDLRSVKLRALELGEAFQSLLHYPVGTRSLRQPSTSTAGSKLSKRRWLSRYTIERLVVRASAALLLLAIVFFPTPDNIATVALLESSDKELYYAPSSATVHEVCVETDQSVKKGAPLIKLVDHQLQSRLEELQGQKRTTQEQLQLDRRIGKLGKQTPAEDLQLTSRIEQLEINLDSIDKQIGIIQSQIGQLTILAKRDAAVISWDAKNQLHDRPVTAGQLLLTTYQPNAPWQLRVAIPERQLGRLRAAMASAREGLPVQFSLASHPSEICHGRLVRLSDQLVKDDDGVGKAIGIVAVDSRKLPTKSDGAVARATIACGRTYAGWLAIRDAYREASAWWRLNF